MDVAGAERTRQAWRKKKEELDARLAELESRRRELVVLLEELTAASPVGATSPPGNPNGDCAPQVARSGTSHANSSGHPAAPPFPVGREEELDYCLRLLKLRCQAVTEEVAEVLLLAEALHSLARAAAGPDAGGDRPPAFPGPTWSSPHGSSPSAPTPAGSAAQAPAAGPGAAATGVPPAGPSAAAGPGTPPAGPAAAAATGVPPAGSAAAAGAQAAPGAGGPPPAVPPSLASADGLAAIISSPQFQKVAAQLLTQLIKK